ncbi:MAG: carboxypeptidase regulatory-like domain-containing protein [Bryobacterales bacterium]|nr:carboxypeptidase regulatory-like domain-containing protein [Bryobacterales bacterium]
MLTHRLRLACLTALLLLATAAGFAQTITGTLVGSVVDPTGAAITSAEVSVVQSATGAKRTVTTNEQGDFLIGSLQPGAYTLSVTQPGFKTLQRTGIVSPRRDSANRPSRVGDRRCHRPGLRHRRRPAVQVASSERAGVISNTRLRTS